MTKKKKILLSSNTYWNIYNFRYDLINSFLEKGYSIYIAANYDSYEKYFKNLNIHIINIKFTRTKINIFNELIILIKYFNLIYKIKPDLYIGYTFKPNIYGSIASRILKISTINNITGLGYVFIKNNLFTFLFKLILKYSLLKSKAVIFQNNDDRKLFISNKICSFNQSYLIEGSGIDVNKYQFSPINQNNDYIFLFIGRLIKDKGIFEFLEVSNKFKNNNINAKFYIIGEIDSQYRNTKINIETLKNYNVKYLGFVEEVTEYIIYSNCVVLPSYREGLPMCLLEACAIGRPIVTTDVPGCRSVVINNHNGLLCKVKDSEDLYKKMKKMYNFDTKVKLIFSKNSRKLAEEKFNKDIIINAYNKIVNKVL